MKIFKAQSMLVFKYMVSAETTMKLKNENSPYKETILTIQSYTISLETNKVVFHRL